MLYPSKRLALSFLAVSVALLLSCLPSYGRRRSLGTLVDSSYGDQSQPDSWLLTGKSTNPKNGVLITSETVCPNSGLNNNVSPAMCDDTYAFLYQINSDATNLVLTFSGLSRFAFVSPDNSPQVGFGVLVCDPKVTNKMLCTNSQQPSSSNMDWDVVGGDLIVTLQSVKATDGLTFYIAEQGESSDTGPLTPPTISVGGAAIVPPALTFGSQESNTAAPPQTITVANSADFATPLNVKNIAAPNNFVSTDTCSALAPGDNCALFLGFSPTSSGNLSGSLVITDDSPLGSEAVTLSGFGTAGGITVSPSTVVFGTQPFKTPSDPVTVTISNAKSNAQPLQVIGIPPESNPVTGVPDFQQTNNCTVVDPGSSCTLQISFSPSISGLIQSSITLTDSSSDGSHTIVLAGNGTEASTTTAAPSSLQFATQISGTTSAAQTVTITNSSQNNLTTVAVNPTAGFAVTSDNCSTAAVGIGKTCAISVAFQPTIGSHSYTGSLSVANETVGGTLVIPLTGTSLAAPAAPPVFSPGAATYTSPQNVTISDPTPQATIYYTTDGTPPTASSTVYSGPLVVSKTETINAIATAPDYAASAVTSALFTINLPPPSFKISGAPVAMAAGATTGNTSSITVTPGGGFTGVVTLTAAITSSPANAMNPPTLGFGSTNSVNITGSSATTATLTITTTSSTISALRLPNPRHNGWRAAGGVSLAFVLLFGIPKRSRRWHILLGLFLALLTVTNGLVACGGGSGGSGNTTQGSSGTTPGAYTITVTGTSGPLTETGTIALTVN
jgi:hypothetical protein